MEQIIASLPQRLRSHPTCRNAALEHLWCARAAPSARAGSKSYPSMAQHRQGEKLFVLQ